MFRSRFGDRWIDISLFVLSLLGIVMIGSASVDSSLNASGITPILNMVKQAAFVIAGFIAMWFLRKNFSTRLLKRRLVRLVYLVVLAAMLVCLAFPAINGSRAWIPIFSLFSLQPSEFAKLAIMMILAYMMVDMPQAHRVSPYMSASRQELERRERRKMALIYPLGLCLSLVAICVLLQRDFGSAIILLGITVVCFFSAPDRYYEPIQKKAFIIMVVGILAILVLFPLLLKILPDGYQKDRILVWLDPLMDPSNVGFQQINGLIAFTKEGLMGAGLGNSTQKFGYVPEANNDFITAIIFEELGIFGFALFMIPYTVIIWRLFSHAFKTGDPKARILLCGTGTYFFLHLFLNLGGVSGLIPMTGIPLLCVSMGGSSTVCAYMSIGIAQACIIADRKKQALKERQHGA